MDLKGDLVSGSVLISHQLNEGKHDYKVENVVKYKKEKGTKMFARGDRLMEINGVDLQDITPEKLVEELSRGNPMLTVHKTDSKKEHSKNFPSDEDALLPFSKESTVLNFSWEMTREDENKAEEGGEEKNMTSLEEDICREKNGENTEGGDLLFIQMIKTSISLVRGRGCEPGSPCQCCNGTGCTFNDVVLVAESSRVTFVPQGSTSFRMEKLAKVFLEHVLSHNYLSGICSQKTLVPSPNPKRITIYYYKSNGMDQSFRGMPVVLNLTDSNCFLRCCKEGDKVLLQVETCEMQRLRQISKSDESTLAFVFYMKADRTKQRKFESALHQGWFMSIVNPDLVEMETLDGGREDPSFLFIIQK
ncbi:interleukin-1 family member A [Melanotaenia boesemani]|uniref:interleukin-1 family member A n=1 Tax=Melanotaenia boesemani TaxID=1250792 RepID=UPI001C05111E|nr:interleukin-1 family member A [Melanotaenia boesemani]